MRLKGTAGLLPLLAALACCGGPQGGGEPAGALENGLVGNSLDQLARESGALPDSGLAAPEGRYARRSAGETDRLCLLPAADGRGDRFRFGVESRFGADEFCRGRGSARREGDRLILRFEGRARDCVMIAGYEGDRIVMPGTVDSHCAALCNHRGSLAGVAFPRVDGDVAKARVMADKDGAPLCG